MSSSVEDELVAIVIEINFWKLWKLYFSDEELFKIFLYLLIYFVQQRSELIAKKIIVGHGKIPGVFLNIIFVVLSI